MASLFKGYKLFKAGYPRQIMIKPNVKKGNEAVHFLVRCHVNAEMKKKQYLVYVHLHQHSGDIAYAKCYCPAGCCKHVAATLYQVLNYIKLGLSDIPDDKTCTQELQKWHVPSNVYNMSGRVVSDIQTRAEGESLYIRYNTDANVVNNLKNDSSYEFIGEVILKINVF